MIGSRSSAGYTLISLSLFVQHLLEQVELAHCHHHNSEQLDDCEVLDFVLVICDDFSVDYLPLLFEELILGDFLQPLSHVDQLSMQLVNLTLLGQL